MILIVLKIRKPRQELNVPVDAGSVLGASVILGLTVCVSDDGPGGGDVMHTETFHTGRPLRAGGLSQVTFMSSSSRDLSRRSEKEVALKDRFTFFFFNLS